MHEEAGTYQLKHLPACSQAVPKDRCLHPKLQVAEQDHLFAIDLNHLWFSFGESTIIIIISSWIAFFQISVQVCVFVDCGGDEFVAGVK